MLCWRRKVKNVLFQFVGERGEDSPVDRRTPRVKQQHPLSSSFVVCEQQLECGVSIFAVVMLGEDVRTEGRRGGVRGRETLRGPPMKRRMSIAVVVLYTWMAMARPRRCSELPAANRGVCFKLVCRCVLLSPLMLLSRNGDDERNDGLCGSKSRGRV
ncbi:unnamed protein product [Ectocarpus sp. 6 AP-2014]